MKYLNTYQLFESARTAHDLLHFWVTTNIKSQDQRHEISGQLEDLYDELSAYKKDKTLYRYQALKTPFTGGLFLPSEYVTSYSSTEKGARAIQDAYDVVSEPTDWIIFKRDFTADEILVDLEMFYVDNQSLGYPSYHRMVKNEMEVLVMPNEFTVTPDMIIAEKKHN